MQFFRNSRKAALLALAAVACVSLASGCNFSKKEKGSKEEAWVVRFQAELAKTEKRFFEQRYLQRKADPFYLGEVFAKLSADKPMSRETAERIESVREDYTESWPVLTRQLERTQRIFAITAVLPAYRATLALTLAGAPDVENAAMIATFKASVEKGAVFNKLTDELDISPEVRAEVAELANKIAVRTLELLKGRGGSFDLLRSEIRLLNPVAAEAVGLPLAPKDEPFIENPVGPWGELRGVYDRIFSVLAAMTQVSGLHEQIGTQKVTRKQAKALKLRLETAVGDIRLQLAELPDLQKKETVLLEKVIFATEKQFAVGKLLAEGKK